MTDNVLPTSDDLLTKLVGYFDEAEQSTDDMRFEAELHRDYYDGKQLTDEEISVLDKRGQPPVIDNKIKDKIDTLLGMEIEVRTDPKAFPRTPAHESAAFAATDAIRYVSDNNRLPQVKSEVGNNMFVEGTGGASITIDKKGVIRVKHILWDRIFFDPHSRRKDFSDAKYLGEAIWMDLDDAKAKYPDAEDEFDISISEAHSKYGETYADKPLAKWVDPKRKRVRIVEIYHKEKGMWHRAVVGRYTVLEQGEESVYLDDEGMPEHPYSFRSAYVDRNGQRYGVVRRYKDLQDEHNKRRSKMLHLASARTVVGDAGAVDNITLAKEELKKPDGWITKNPGKEINILSNDVEIQAQTSLLLHTDNALSQTGPNAAIQGLSGRISGRAKQLDQQAGTVNLGTLFDGLADWELTTYRKIWNRVRQFWTDEKWIRVRDDERDLKFVSLNHVKTLGEVHAELSAAAEQAGQPPPPPPPNPNAPYLDQNGNTVKENDVVDLDVDIIIERAPDLVTIQQEQFSELAAMAQAGLPIPPDIVIEASSLRNKRQILATLRGETPEAQQQQQFGELMQRFEVALKELEVVQAQADVEKTKSETVENYAQADKDGVEAFQAAMGEEKIS